MQHRDSIAISLSLISGLVGYSGVWWLLPCAMLSVVGWGLSSNRRAAFVAMFAYYLSATRGLFQGGGVFFAGSIAPSSFSWQWGLFVWLFPSVVLALVWSSCWGERRIGLRAVVALTVVSIPPVGFLGFVNPVAGLGVWLPGLAWLGVLIGIVVVGLLAMAGQAAKLGQVKLMAFGYRQGVSIMTCLVISGVALVVQPAAGVPAPAGWVGVDTALGSVDGYKVLRQVQDATVQAVQDRKSVV